MSKETWVPLLVAGLVVAGIAGGTSYCDHLAEEDARVAREERAALRVEREAHAMDTLRTESMELMPEVVEGVALGMSVDEVRALRHTRMSHSADEADPGLDMWVERLRTGGQVIYLFEDATGTLVQLQVLSLLPTTSAIPPHLTAMAERYGTPTGVWDCPLTGDVPTRRFTWRRSETTVSDVFLITPTGVSVTLFITTSDRTEASLRRSACHPVAPEDLDTFHTVDHVPTPK